MNYNQVKKEQLKDLFKVIRSYNLDEIKANEFLTNENPKVVKNVKGQYYLTDTSLFNQLNTYCNE